MKSLARALRLLEEFASDADSFGVSELSRRTGLTRSHVSRLLSEFARTGILKQDPGTKAYSVGLSAYILGSRFIGHDALARESIPVLRHLMDITGHSARVCVMHGDRLLYLLCVEGPLFMDTGIRAGNWLPIHSTSAGRVLLAYLEPARSRKLLQAAALTKFTTRTVTDRKSLLEMLERIRESGYAVQRGETTAELGALTVPVFGADQEILAALTVALPSHLLTKAVEAKLAEQAHYAARGISLRMGAASYPYGTPRGALPYARARSRVFRR